MYNICHRKRPLFLSAQPSPQTDLASITRPQGWTALPKAFRQKPNSFLDLIASLTPTSQFRNKKWFRVSSRSTGPFKRKKGNYHKVKKMLFLHAWVTNIYSSVVREPIPGTTICLTEIDTSKYYSCNLHRCCSDLTFLLCVWPTFLADEDKFSPTSDIRIY